MNEILWSPGMTLAAMERQVILKAIQHFRFNKTITANALGISVRTLDNKLDQYDYEVSVEKQRQENELKMRQEFLERQRGNPPNNVGIPYSPLPVAVTLAASAPAMASAAIVNEAQTQTAHPAKGKKK